MHWQGNYIWFCMESIERDMQNDIHKMIITVMSFTSTVAATRANHIIWLALIISDFDFCDLYFDLIISDFVRKVLRGTSKSLGEYICNKIHKHSCCNQSQPHHLFRTFNMWPCIGKPTISRKMLFRVIHRFRLVTGILWIFSFVHNHKEQC